MRNSTYKGVIESQCDNTSNDTTTEINSQLENITFYHLCNKKQDTTLQTDSYKDISVFSSGDNRTYVENQTINVFNSNMSLIKYPQNANFTQNSTSNIEFWTPLYISLLGIISIGLMLNTVTLLMFFRHKLPKSGSNRLVLNLTCCDLFSCSVSYPLLLYALVFHTWPFESTGCRYYMSTFLLLGTVSNNSMTAIAVDRYYTVTKSHQNTERVRKQIKHSLLASWLGGMLSTSPLLIGWVDMDTQNDGFLCMLKVDEHNYTIRAYSLYFTVVGLLVPFAIKAICYYNLYETVHSVARQINYKKVSILPLAIRISKASRASQSSITSRNITHRRQSTISNISTGSAISNVNNALQRIQDGDNIKQESKLAKVMILIVFFSLFSWGPFATVLLFLAFKIHVASFIYVAVSILAKSCVVFNPLIYVVFNKKFRKIFFRTLKCYYHQPVELSRRPTRRSIVTPQNVPQNAGPHTRALHRYSNSKRYSVPTLSTINELETRHNTVSPNQSDDETKAKTLHKKRIGKVSLPESEIRKATELMRGKDRKEFLKYVKKSRPHAPGNPENTKRSKSNEMDGKDKKNTIRKQSVPQGPKTKRVAPSNGKLTKLNGHKVSLETLSTVDS